MKFPLTWLEELIHVKAHPQQIGKILTSLGLEVDAIETLSPGFSNVVVGLVKKVEKHPEADKLCIATVTDGTDEFQVVCGDPSCRPNLKTAFAKIGATLPDGDSGTFIIKKTKLRGVESQGMLCSGKELGINEDDTSIMHLPDHLQVGQEMATLYGDMVFEISLTPNLAHCQNLIGIARELAAATGETFKKPIIHVKESQEKKISSEVKVTNNEPEKCPRYSCRLIKNVKVKPSPPWLQKKLTLCGLRPINNVVDVTNYVLLELGQPLHAFDFNKVSGGELIVRTARDEELFITLDGKERTLSEEDLLICDQHKALAIAGVMGGQNSEVTETTQNVLIESAYFEPTTIRKTSKRLGLQTDASKRFERGTDPENVIKALDRVAMLIQELADGEVLNGIIDILPKPIETKQIALRLERVNLLLGLHLSLSEVEDVFRRLGFPIEIQGKNILNVSIPSYRVDLSQEVDLIDEVARIYGLDNIPRKSAKYHHAVQSDSPFYAFQKSVRSILISEGLQEFLTCDLIGPTIENIVNESLVPDESIIRVLNPTSIEQSTLRTSFLHGLLQVVKHNHDHQNFDVSGFETGYVHFRKEGGVEEIPVCGIVMTGKMTPHHWNPKPREIDFYDIKGVIENLLQEMGVDSITFVKSELPNFHTGRQAAIFSNQLKIGVFGEVHPSIQRRLDLSQRIYFAEIDLRDLAGVSCSMRKMEEISPFPCSERDWTLTLSKSIPVQTIIDSVQAVPSRLLESISLHDVYENEKLGKNKMNVTFRLTYRDKKKTISQETLDAEHARILNHVTSLDIFRNSL